MTNISSYLIELPVVEENGERPLACIAIDKIYLVQPVTQRYINQLLIDQNKYFAYLKMK